MQRAAIGLGHVGHLAELFVDVAQRRFIEQKFGKRPDVSQANVAALKAGYHYGETVEAISTQYQVGPAKLPAGTYRNIMGNAGLGLGPGGRGQSQPEATVPRRYPITPASDILHDLAEYKNFDVLTFQAEDEIAAMTAAIGAAFGGAMAVTATSGPGIALKGEAMGLAVMTELPMIIINVQRGGPAPVCRPRPNRPTCCRPCSAATANARCP